ncbi:hypothetical protein [Natronomonas sp.]|uniref:hypothetical protein n=1 Tax=Natronomonas sp. TaxID=2184060 RepID=UPI003976D62E
MFRRLRELGPSLLVPLAWTFVTAAHLGIVVPRTLFIAHVVMAVLLAGFAVTGRADMREGVLRVWWRIIAVGVVVTLAGVLSFRVDVGVVLLSGIALGGWMLLPAVGFAYTGRRVAEGAWIYFGGAAACLAGASLYAAGLFGAVLPLWLGGLVCVGIGQTAGILDATLRY